MAERRRVSLLEKPTPNWKKKKKKKKTGNRESNLNPCEGFGV
jgi:hypothetical protein